MNGKLTEDEFVQTVETSALNGDYGEISDSNIHANTEPRNIAKLAESLDENGVQKLIKGLDRLLYADSADEATRLLPDRIANEEKKHRYYTTSNMFSDRYTKVGKPSALLACETFCIMIRGSLELEDTIFEFYKDRLNGHWLSFSMEMNTFKDHYHSVNKILSAKKHLAEHQKAMTEKKGEKIASSDKPTTQNSYSAGLSKTNSHGGR